MIIVSLQGGNKNIDMGQTATFPNMTAAITIPQVDFQFLKELANRFGWIVQTEKRNGIDEALDDVRNGHVYHADSAHDLMEQCLS